MPAQSKWLLRHLSSTRRIDEFDPGSTDHYPGNFSSQPGAPIYSAVFAGEKFCGILG